MPSYAYILLWVAVAVGAFHAAYAFAGGSFLIVLYLFALLQLARADRWRKAFYPGLAVGLLIAAVRLAFFWRIFSGGALALWLVYALWIGLFVALARLCLRRAKWGWLLIPFLWTGLEYFRSELYYLRFSWLNVGYAFAGAPWQTALKVAGVYGEGFLLVALAVVAAWRWQKSKLQAGGLLLLGIGAICLGALLAERQRSAQPAAGVRIAGVQMEFPNEREVLVRLKDLIRRHPEAQLLVLSEYTLDGPVPQALKDWCRQEKRYLVVGGKEPLPGGKYYNTSFVVGPDGGIVFSQAKAVPIQFFKDGLRAPEQKVWESPWGRIGICVCYDLSYTRVTDRLVRLGAQAIIVPTMDVMDWGSDQHVLHARIAPVRATEYGLPIFRLASSGISQWTDRAGRVVAAAPCPGDGAILAGTLDMRGAGTLPLDRWLAPFAVGVTALFVCWLLVGKGLHLLQGRTRKADCSETCEVGRAVPSAPPATECAKPMRVGSTSDGALGTARPTFT
jgi:apolipoprotein N-acyltransferase